MRAKNNTAVRCAPVVVDFVVVAGNNSRGSRRRAIILAVAIHKSTGSEREPQNVNTTQLRTVQCQCALQLSRYFAANNDLLLTLFQIVSFIGNIIDCLNHIHILQQAETESQSQCFILRKIISLFSFLVPVNEKLSLITVSI